MSSVNRYKIYCTTESAYIEGWGTDEPTSCYNNNTHTVNPNSVQLMETVSTSVVQINQNTYANGNNFGVRNITLSAASSSTTTDSYTFAIPTTMHSFYFNADSEHIGDKIDIAANLNQTVGMLGENISPGDTIIHVPVAISLYGYLGFYIRVTDGVNTNDLGYIVSMDKVNNTVVVKTPATNSFDKTNTFVQMTYYVIKDFTISGIGHHAFGSDLLSGANIPLNTAVSFTYTNNNTNLSDPNRIITIYMSVLF